MAKIARRAVASSPSPSSSNTPTATSTSSAYAPSSAASTSNAAKSTTNANNIANGGKPARVATSEISAKLADPHYGGSIGAVAADPARINGNASNQFATHGSRGAYATNTTTTGSNEHTLYTAQPTLIDSGGKASPSPPPYQPNKTAELILERKLIREQFFATYDVMTGVRIAATLSGFFGLMVFLIVWKSRSSSNETLKVLKDPKMAAVAAVCMQEEEEREIQEAMVATGMSIYPDEYDAILYRRQRMLSLGNVSAPPMLNRGFRFSSVGGGGYSSLLEPPRRFSYSAASGAVSLAGGRRKSGSESSRILSNYPLGSSFGNDDYFMETEDELECADYPPSAANLDDLADAHKRNDSTRSKRGFLEVPLMGQDSRRSSAMTCCSTESSYLERRCSAFTLGLGNLPPSLQRKLSTASRTSSTDNWDYYYPDIQVIQPTPKPSPGPSERSLSEQLQPPISTTSTAAAAVAATSAIAAAPKAATIATSATTIKTGKLNIAAIGGGGAGLCLPEPPTFVRKHSIAYYDPDSAQGGRKQEIHSISADTADVYPYNRALFESSVLISGSSCKPPLQSAPPIVAAHHGFRFSDSPTEDLRASIRGKIAMVEMQRLAHAPEPTTPPPGVSAYENNNNFPYTNSAAAIAAAAVAAGVTAAATANANANATANSSSISIDSTPMSIDKLNGSGSLGTISAKALFNMEKRAPLASLSSFKISSLEYQDSEARSLDEDSVFLDSVADTDEDMRQLSSDSEEASLGEHDPTCTRENVALVSQGSAEASATGGARTSQQPHKYPIEKRFSLGAANAGGANVSRARRPLLQRHRTISVSSTDRVALIGHQLREFHQSSGSGSPSTGGASAMPLETHFGSIICTNSSPTHPRRAQLLQQYSDPQSLPTTTATTTEEDTCSTLNTEVCGGAGAGEGRSSGGGGAGGGGSTTHTQHSSLNTVVSFGRGSPQTDSNQLSCYSVSAPVGAPIAAAALTTTDTRTPPNQTNKQQLPRSRFGDDPCASSISDSVINATRPPVICMPSSLKNLILRGSTTSAEKPTAATAPMVSRSATNLSMLDAGNGGSGACPSVMLELPLIKLPTDDSSDNSSASDEMERGGSRSDESHDPSLPGSSRKWSKETLF